MLVYVEQPPSAVSMAVPSVSAHDPDSGGGSGGGGDGGGDGGRGGSVDRSGGEGGDDAQVRQFPQRRFQS